jgi:hypothetical protein
MKKITLLSIAMIAGLSVPAAVHAQTIGVQFPPYYAQPYSTLNGNTGGGPSGSTMAGVAPQGNWNDAMGPSNLPDSFGGGDGQVTGDITNANLFTYIPNAVPGAYPNNGAYTSSPTTLIDSTGTASGIIFHLSGANSERGGNGDGNAFTGTNSAGNAALVNGGAYNTGGAVSLSLAGLVPTDYYTLYAYAHADYYFYNGLAAEMTLGSQSVYFTSGNTLTGLTMAMGSSAANANLADYAAFTVLGSTLENESLTVNGLAADGTTIVGGVGLAGFQLVDDGSTPPAVPEPSTVWMFSLGFLGLMVHVYRKRYARS